MQFVSLSPAPVLVEVLGQEVPAVELLGLLELFEIEVAFPQAPRCLGLGYLS